MFKYFLTLIVLIPIFSFAQEDTTTGEQSETLFNQLESFSVMGGFLLDFSQADQDLQVSSGGGGAVILNKQIYLGGYGLGFNGAPRENNREMDYGHGGFWLGYIFTPRRILHFNADLQLGWGSLAMHESSGLQVFKDNVFVINPAVVAEMNLTSWLRFQARAGYRINTGLDNEYFDNGAFSSPNLMLGLVAGWFN